MTLKLYFHPLSSFCQKVLIALYENATPFEPHFINLMEEAGRAELNALWPVGKFPVLRDEARDRTVPESTIIIEYLAQHYPGKVALLPADPDRARETRLRDRFYDLHLHSPMQKLVGDRFRPEGQRDAFGVAEAKQQIETALGMIDREMASRRWAMGEAFTMADCAAAPPLFYVNMLLPFGETHPQAAAYLRRLMERPAYARALEEAKPYLGLVPKEG
jgi:glutathione S-transferase